MQNQFIKIFRNTSKSLFSTAEKQARSFFVCVALFGLSALAAFAAPTGLDKAFGTNGLTVKEIGDVSYFKDVAVQPDGKIVAAGTSTMSGNARYLAARFNADGTPDATFGGGSGYITVSPGGSNNYVKTVLILPDGKILLVAHNDATKNIDVLRRLSNGDADTSFNGTGTLSVAIGTGDDVPNDALLMPDGRILIGGACQDGFVNGNPGFPKYNMCFAFVTPNASSSDNFVSPPSATSKFVAQTPADNSSGIKSIALLPDGKIIAAGYQQTNSSQQTVLLRLHANGAVDTNFGDQGYVFPATVYPFQVAEKITVLPDGKLFVAGTVSTILATFDESGDGNFFFVRLNSDGGSDQSFGGTRYVDFQNRNDFLYDMTVLPNGKIFLAGGSQNGGVPSDFATVRLLPNGNLDSSYGSGGKHLHAMSGFERLHAVALQTNGKVIGAGVASLNGAWKTALAQYSEHRAIGDFDGDGRADIAVFRPSNGTWYVLRSSDNQLQAAQFGISTDKPVASDYDGDGKTDIAVYRSGVWYILQSSNNAFRAFQHGADGDVPKPMSFYGTERADLAVFSPNGGWSVMSNPLDVSPNLGTAIFAERFGQSGDLPVPGFYDNDSAEDFAVFRPSNGTWYVKPRFGNQMQSVQFGTAGDIPQPADFDGDRKSDTAVYRPSNGTWYVLRSSDNQFQAAQFGISEDIPVARDFDGDGRADYAVFRPSSGMWYLLQTTKGFAAAKFGIEGDVPSN